MKVKVYVVRSEDGKLLAVKLTYAAAHAIARQFAPASVTMMVADKKTHLTSPPVDPY